MKKLILLIFLISFAKISNGTCGLSCYYKINQGSPVSLYPAINSTFNIYMNSGDSVEFGLSLSGWSGCFYCVLDSVYWTFDGFAASDTQSCVHDVDFIAQTPGIYVLHLDWDYLPLQTITLNIILNPVSVSANSLKNILNINPNPFSDHLSISIQKQNVREIAFFIRDVLGQAILIEQEKNPPNIYKKEMDLSALLKGIYFLETNIDGLRTVTKIVKE